MLSKPVLDKLSNFFCDWDNSTLYSVHDAQVSASMLSNIVLVVQDCGKHTLLITEVLIEKNDHFVPDSLIFTVGFNLSDSIKKSNMFIIKLLYVYKERLIPNIRVRNNIVSTEEQLSSVGKVSVLDVLCQPVFGPGSHLSAEWSVSILELGLEVVMLQVMAITVIVWHLAEFRLFIVKMHAEEGFTG